MTTPRRRPRSRAATALLLVTAGAVAALLPESALAYGGPGSVITGIGAFVAAVVAVLAAVLGFFWFPLKRLYQRLQDEESTEDEEVAEAP